MNIWMNELKRYSTSVCCTVYSCTPCTRISTFSAQWRKNEREEENFTRTTFNKLRCLFIINGKNVNFHGFCEFYRNDIFIILWCEILRVSPVDSDIFIWFGSQKHQQLVRFPFEMDHVIWSIDVTLWIRWSSHINIKHEHAMSHKLTSRDLSDDVN